jgi:hypothetical protein
MLKPVTFLAWRRCVAIALVSSAVIGAAGGAEVPRVRAAGRPLHHLRPPIVLTEAQLPNRLFEVIIRLDGPLPRLKDGSPDAGITLNGKSYYASITTVSRKHNCYQQTFDPSPIPADLHWAQAGTKVRVGVQSGRSIPTVTTRLQRRKYNVPRSAQDPTYYYAKQLGCFG